MKFNLTEEDKKRIINQNISAMETQLYSEILFVGLNPDTFEPSDLDGKDTIEDNILYSRLRDILNKLNNLKAM